MNIDWNILWSTLLTRATERSTWLGLIALLAAFGITVAPEHVELIASLGSAFAGVLLVATKDNKTVTVNPVITIQTVETVRVPEPVAAALAANVTVTATTPEDFRTTTDGTQR